MKQVMNITSQTLLELKVLNQPTELIEKTVSCL